MCYMCFYMKEACPYFIPAEIEPTQVFAEDVP